VSSLYGRALKSVVLSDILRERCGAVVKSEADMKTLIRFCGKKTLLVRDVETEIEREVRIIGEVQRTEEVFAEVKLDPCEENLKLQMQNENSWADSYKWIVGRCSLRRT